jgi:putative transposase
LACGTENPHPHCTGARCFCRQQRAHALYWSIGRDILARQHDQGWGAKVVNRLAADLRHEFPEARGFSRANLLYMRAFAEAWPDQQIVQQVVGQLPWSQNIELLTVKDPAARLWYLAVVLDACSRKIVGWSMANHLRTELVLDALELAVGQRRPHEVIHHSDQGSQYTSLAFGCRCREVGVRPSMGSVGDAYDNAMCESFFSTLECELLSRRKFVSQAEAKIACFSYIEGFYNPVRLHSAIGYQSPIHYEQQSAQELAVTP